MDPLDAQLIAESWRRGDLTWLLDADQFEQHKKLWNGDGDFFACISRQRGKTWWAVAECLMYALRHPGAQIKYASLTQKSVHGIIGPILKEQLVSCTDELKPRVDLQRGEWVFPNDSVITVAGVDNQHYTALRGTKAHFVVCDEAAFFADYEAVEAVLAPQLLTTRSLGGRCLQISTPPESPAHPWRTRYYSALANGRAVHRTIYNHPRLSSDDVERFIGGEAQRRGQEVEEFKGSTYFRREFLAEFVTEESRAAVPGWNQEKHKQLVREVPRPQHFDCYTSIDLGFGDPHAALFAYWCFPEQLLVIEDELLLRQANTEVLADAIKAKETQLWGVNRFEGKLHGAKTFENLPEWLRETAIGDAPKQPWLRIGDNDPLALGDLIQRHGLAVLPSKKDNKHLAVDALDQLIRNNGVVIHPRCTGLVEQLYGVTWNRARTQWERNEKGHGDLIDAFVYLVRNVNKHKDPRPKAETAWEYSEGRKKPTTWERAFRNK